MRRLAANRGARQPTRPPRRGAALLEALIGGAILGGGLAVLIALTTNSIARQQLGEQRLVAAHLLDNLLSMVVVEGPLDFPKRHDTQGGFPPPFDDYAFSITLKDQGDAEPYLVTATVSWEFGGHVRSESIQTYIAQPRGEVMELREPGTPISR